MLIRYLALAGFATGFYFSANASVGQDNFLAQMVSIVCAVTVLVMFVLIKWRFKLLEFIGRYSYEIYLLHWPLMYRYDFIYKLFPPALGTVVYVILLIGSSGFSIKAGFSPNT